MIKELDNGSIGVPQGTSSYTKEAQIKNARLDVISTADDGVNITEPSSPSHGQYPWVKVERSLSGHIKEVDDTPGAERILDMHKTGTMREVHPDGSQVVKIFGEDFYICLKDHNLVIGGNLNITVQGNASLLVKGDLKQKIGGNLETTVFGDMVTKVGGNITVSSDKTLAMESKNMTARTSETYKVYSKGNLDINGEALGTFNFNQTKINARGVTYIQGASVRINDGGGSTPKAVVKDSGKKLGLNIQDSVVEPAFDAVVINSLDNTNLTQTVNVSAIKYPKDRTKS